MDYSYSRLQLEYIDGSHHPRQYEWVWRGDNPYVAIDYQELFYQYQNEPKVGQVLRFGAYRLRFVEQEQFMHWVFVREDWLGLPRLYSRKAARLASDVYYRVLMTLWIWGLLDRDEYTPVSWRDIKLVKWLMRRGKQ